MRNVSCFIKGDSMKDYGIVRTPRKEKISLMHGAGGSLGERNKSRWQKRKEYRALKKKLRRT